MSINSRIFELLKMQNKKPAELARFLGIKSNVISDWKIKGTNPSSDKISSICDFFNVNTDWFLTGEGEMYKLTNSIIKEEELIENTNDKKVILREDEIELLEYYNNLPEFERGRTLERLVSQVKEKNKITSDDTSISKRKLSKLKNSEKTITSEVSQEFSATSETA